MVTKLVKEFYGDKLAETYDKFALDEGIDVKMTEVIKFVENHEQEIIDMIPELLPIYQEWLGTSYSEELIKERPIESIFKDAIFMFFQAFSDYIVKNIYDFDFEFYQQKENQ